MSQLWARRGVAACLLLPLAWIYGAVVSMRVWAYRHGLLRVERLDVPVVIVGNVVAGGAGKTPTVMAVVRALQSNGFIPGVVSRGYGRASHAVLQVTPETAARDSGDEPLLLRRRLNVPVMVGADRVAAARALRKTNPQVNVIVTDDGLQHRRLARDVEVVVFDERGAGNGWLLPAGWLREPLSVALNDRSLIVFNAEAAPLAREGFRTTRKIAGLLPLADWWSGERALPESIQAFRGRALVAAAGTARPQRFFDALRALGLRIEALPLPDHFAFDTLPWPKDAADIVVTEKDAVKLVGKTLGSTRVWVAPLDFGIESGFYAALIARLRRH